MRLTAFVSDKGYENAIYPGLIRGAALHGDTITTKPLAEYAGPEQDGGVLLGVVKREALWDHQRLGVPVVYVDKGYTRDRAVWKGMNLPAYWRICVGAVHPTDYLMDIDYPSDRLRRQGTALHARRTGSHVVIAGSSAKYHLTMGLPHPTEWASDLVREIRKRTDAPIIYRPKPSWKGAERVGGAVFDWGRKTPFETVLRDARCVVTYGSIASVDAICSGVPVIALGNAPARPVSATSLDALTDPFWPPENQRLAWASNLAYHHYTPAELADGSAWAIVKAQIAHVQSRAQR